MNCACCSGAKPYWSCKKKASGPSLTASAADAHISTATKQPVNMLWPRTRRERSHPGIVDMCFIFLRRTHHFSTRPTSHQTGSYETCYQEHLGRPVHEVGAWAHYITDSSQTRSDQTRPDSAESEAEDRNFSSRRVALHTWCRLSRSTAWRATNYHLKLVDNLASLSTHAVEGTLWSEGGFGRYDQLQKCVAARRDSVVLPTLQATCFSEESITTKSTMHFKSLLLRLYTAVSSLLIKAWGSVGWTGNIDERRGVSNKTRSVLVPASIARAVGQHGWLWI